MRGGRLRRWSERWEGVFGSSWYTIWLFAYRGVSLFFFLVAVSLGRGGGLRRCRADKYIHGGRAWREQGWMVPPPRGSRPRGGFCVGYSQWDMGTRLLGQDGEKASRTESSETCERKKTQQHGWWYLPGRPKAMGLLSGIMWNKTGRKASEKRIVEHHE